jgi:hypothetical protein
MERNIKMTNLTIDELQDVDEYILEIRTSMNPIINSEIHCRNHRKRVKMVEYDFGLDIYTKTIKPEHEGIIGKLSCGCVTEPFEIGEKPHNIISRLIAQND